MVHNSRDSTVSDLPKDLRRIPVCNWVPWPSQRCPNRSTVVVVLFCCLCWVRFMVDKWYEKAISLRDDWRRKQRRLWWYFGDWLICPKKVFWIRIRVVNVLRCQDPWFLALLWLVSHEELKWTYEQLCFGSSSTRCSFQFTVQKSNLTFGINSTYSSPCLLLDICFSL